MLNGNFNFLSHSLYIWKCSIYKLTCKYFKLAFLRSKLFAILKLYRKPNRLRVRFSSWAQGHFSRFAIKLDCSKQFTIKLPIKLQVNLIYIIFVCIEIATQSVYSTRMLIIQFVDCFIQELEYFHKIF